MMCDSYARRKLCSTAIVRGCFALREPNTPPKYLGNKSRIAHLNNIIPENFTTPPP